VLRSLHLTNVTLFQQAELHFSPGLNVFVGENGSGKSQLLKLAYVMAACLQDPLPTRSVLQSLLADKLVAVLRPEALGRLVRRRAGRERAELVAQLGVSDEPLKFRFATNSRSEVVVEAMPGHPLTKRPCFIPTRELLTIAPGFVALYESRVLEFEETWRDTCLLLQAPALRGPRQRQIQALLAPLERAMGGQVESDQNGRFYLRQPGGRLEMPLVAEGLRKLAMLARLIATGELLDAGMLFWDEPEANLNPRLLRPIAQTILALSRQGLQVFIATHSLFLLRELELLLAESDLQPDQNPMFFGLHPVDAAVDVQGGPELACIGSIAALDEELDQEDRAYGHSLDHAA
jgi:energy-coupling factor transporter ATP-binding protein EcfA2